MRKIAAVLLIAFLFTSCNEYNKILKSNDYEKKYAYAKRCFEEKKYNRAYTLLEGLVSMFKGTAYGEESLYLLAMSYYLSGDYISAGQYFITYYKTYPRGEYAELARFYTGYGYYKEAPEPKLDQTVTYRALSELQSFLERYPRSEKAEEAQNAIIELQERLVEKELHNIKLYYDLGNYLRENYYESAVVTAQNALRDYPYTKYKERLYFLILRSRYEEAIHSIPERREERYRGVVDEYYSYINEFPEGTHLKEARRMFETAEKQLKKY